MRAECVCTGIILVEDDVAYNGDLFEMGEVYLVNVNEASAHGAGLYLLDKGKRWITPTGDYWTRRGVYAIPVGQAKLSIAALEYMGK